jgi:hypothetical protein
VGLTAIARSHYFPACAAPYGFEKVRENNGFRISRLYPTLNSETNYTQPGCGPQCGLGSELTKPKLGLSSVPTFMSLQLRGVGCGEVYVGVVLRQKLRTHMCLKLWRRRGMTVRSQSRDVIGQFLVYETHTAWNLGPSTLALWAGANYCCSNVMLYMPNDQTQIHQLWVWKISPS